MGFDAVRTFKLEWPEDHLLHGALIRIRSSSIGASLRIRATLPWEELIQMLCEHIVEWDLESEGQPIPLEAATVMATLDQVTLKEIASAWQEASTMVPAPLGARSGDGRRSPDMEDLEQSMPMEVSSSSPLLPVKPNGS